MTQQTTKPELELLERAEIEEPLLDETAARAARERSIARLRLLWEHRRFLLRTVGYGLLVSTLLAFLIPKRYESTARLMPPDQQSGQGLAMLAALSGRTGGQGGLGAMAGDLLGLKSSSALFVGVLRSRTVEDRLIERFNLKKVYRWVPIGEPRIEDVREELEDNTRVAEDRKSGIITVTVSDRNPQRARDMARAYVEELDRLVAQVSTSAARRERIFLEERLKTVKQELDQAAVEFSQFASKNTAIDIKEQGRAMVEAAATLQGQVIAVQTELEGLRQIYTDSNVRVRTVRARIAELQRQLEKLGGKDLDASDTPAGAIGSSGQGGESLYPSIRKLPLLGVPYSDLYRRTKIAEVVFELLTQQYELARVQEANEIPTVKVLDAPVVPEKKSFPPRLFILALGTALAFVTGIAWILGTSRWNEIDTQDPAKVLASEVITAVREGAHWGSSNGRGPNQTVGGLRGWLRRGTPESQPESKSSAAGSDQGSPKPAESESER